MSASATGNDAVATLPCSHCFHVRCVLRLARSFDDNHGRCALCRALEGKRADGATEKSPHASGAKPSSLAPALSGPKAMYLDRRHIMHVTRNAGVSVLWPRTTAAAASARRAHHY